MYCNTEHLTYNTPVVEPWKMCFSENFQYKLQLGSDEFCFFQVEGMFLIVTYTVHQKWDSISKFQF